MLRLRRLDGPGRRAYLDELRPRLLVVRVRARRVRFSWAVPLWPFEELLAFGLALALLSAAVLARLPESAGGRLGRARRRLAGLSAGASGADGPPGVAASLSLIAGGGLRDALRLPPGEPYLSVRTHDAEFDVRAY